MLNIIERETSRRLGFWDLGRGNFRYPHHVSVLDQFLVIIRTIKVLWTKNPNSKIKFRSFLVCGDPLVGWYYPLGNEKRSALNHALARAFGFIPARGAGFYNGSLYKIITSLTFGIPRCFTRISVEFCATRPGPTRPDPTRPDHPRPSRYAIDFAAFFLESKLSLKIEIF